MDPWSQICLTSKLLTVNGQLLASAPLLPRKQTQVPMNRRLSGSQKLSRRYEDVKITYHTGARTSCLGFPVLSK